MREDWPRQYAQEMQDPARGCQSSDECNSNGRLDFGGADILVCPNPRVRGILAPPSGFNSSNNRGKNLIFESVVPQASLRVVYGGGRPAATGAASTSLLSADKTAGGQGHG